MNISFLKNVDFVYFMGMVSFVYKDIISQCIPSAIDLIFSLFPDKIKLAML